MEKNSLHPSILSFCLSLSFNTQTPQHRKWVFIQSHLYSDVEWQKLSGVHFLFKWSHFLYQKPLKGCDLKINITYNMIKHLTEEKHNVHTHPQT